MSKAVSELGRAKGHQAAFALLIKYGAERADQLDKKHWPAFIDEALSQAAA